MKNETNKSYRIRTNINKDSNVLVNFTQEYETFELLSIKMKTENLYRLHNANYGVVVGRVQANGGFGVPNAKISIFIEVDQENENSEFMGILMFSRLILLEIHITCFLTSKLAIAIRKSVHSQVKDICLTTIHT